MDKILIFIIIIIFMMPIIPAVKSVVDKSLLEIMIEKIIEKLGYKKIIEDYKQENEKLKVQIKRLEKNEKLLEREIININKKLNEHTTEIYGLRYINNNINESYKKCNIKLQKMENEIKEKDTENCEIIPIQTIITNSTIEEPIIYNKSVNKEDKLDKTFEFTIKNLQDFYYGKIDLNKDYYIQFDYTKNEEKNWYEIKINIKDKINNIKQGILYLHNKDYDENQKYKNINQTYNKDNIITLDKNIKFEAELLEFNPTAYDYTQEKEYIEFEHKREEFEFVCGWKFKIRIKEI